jgi:hypothetical protein
MNDRNPSHPSTEVWAQKWGWAVVLGAVLAGVVGTAAFGGKARTSDQEGAKALNVTKTTPVAQLAQPVAVGQSKTKPVAQPDAVGQSNQGASHGLSYETYIPRPTVKGYYEPKVVPYPVGKPVHVNGYYRKNGTYVQPHFRSLPRR